MSSTIALSADKIISINMILIVSLTSSVMNSKDVTCYNNNLMSSQIKSAATQRIDSNPSHPIHLYFFI